ncbi:MAG: recombinase family protein [Chloroflexota bacterium]
MARPFAYLRKSSVRDPARDLAPETQDREVRELAARHGDVIAPDDVLADWDVSGRAKYTKKRVNYRRLVEAIERGEAGAVYSYSLARLGRSVPELSRLFDLCAERKVPIRLVVDSVDTSTASGRLLANVLASVAQFEAEVAGERLSSMYATKRAKAIELGEDVVEAVRSSRRYGEHRTVFDRDGTEVHLGEGEDDAYVLQVFRETGSYTRAARRLNDEKVKVRSDVEGKKWWASSVGVVVERLDPTLATPGSGRGRPARQDFKLAKLLRCPQDGAMLTGSRIPDKKGKVWTRYSCRHAESVRHPRVSVGEHLIMDAIEAEAALYRDPDEQAEGAVAAQRQALLDRRRRVVESRLDGIIGREEAALRVAEIDAEVRRMDAPRPKSRTHRLVASKTPAEINDVLRSLFDHIVVDPDTFQPATFVWHNPAWRYEDEPADDRAVERLRRATRAQRSAS